MLTAVCIHFLYDYCGSVLGRKVDVFFFHYELQEKKSKCQEISQSVENIAEIQFRV